jgi:hypothetical protein
MKVADPDIQRLIGPAGAAERDKDADTNQKPEQITSPMHMRMNLWLDRTFFPGRCCPTVMATAVDGMSLCFS